MTDRFPLGKLPPAVLANILARVPASDPRIIVGPRVGEDAAVLDLGGEAYLVAKTDPITFATGEIGWYAVHVNANDIAAAGGTPAFFMATVLLPGGSADREMVERIFEQMSAACEMLNISLIGGHTEITHGLDRPIVAGTMFGFAPRDRLITTGGARPRDRLLLTKGFPIEATAIIAREKAGMLSTRFSEAFVSHCAQYLHDPGISVVPDARAALEAGVVHAMHDPTEGGVATGLWEIARASGVRLHVDLRPALLEDAARVCSAVGIDPLGAIASGSLLLAIPPEAVMPILQAFAEAGIAAFEIGFVEAGEAGVIERETGKTIRLPERDEIARLFE